MSNCFLPEQLYFQKQQEKNLTGTITSNIFAISLKRVDNLQCMTNRMNELEVKIWSNFLMLAKFPATRATSINIHGYGNGEGRGVDHGK